MWRTPLRETWLALAVGVMAAVGCGRDAPPGSPIATRIATLDAVNSGRGLVDSLALAPDAGLAATGEPGGQIRVWATAGEPTPLSLGDYRQAVIDLAFSPNGRLLASLGRHRESALRLWRFDDRGGPGAWAEAASLPMGRCLALRFDGSGARLAVLCESEVLIVDVASVQEVLRVANPHHEVLTAFDLSADGRHLMTAGHDGEVAVRDAATAKPVRSFLASLACLRYVWAGATALEREPPFLALSVLLIGIGVGLGVRARAAHLLARTGLGAGLVVIGLMIARLYLGSGARDYPDDRLVAHVYLLGFALAAAGVVVLFLLVRRARSAPAFGAIDLLPVGGLAAALVLGIVWLVADDARLRPCRNGSDEACGVVALALLESAERAPSAPPHRRRSARRACSPSITAGPPTALCAVSSAMRRGPSTPGPPG